MRILPILFNAPMVRSIMDGRKTQTRRVCKITINGNEPVEHGICAEVIYPEKNKDGVCANFYRRQNIYAYCGAAKPAYETGDILYVRETWAKDSVGYLYKADYCDTDVWYQGGIEIKMKWHPSIHMPKEAARIFLRVTDVSVERLQDITGEDCVAEGCDADMLSGVGTEFIRGVFSGMWDSTIKPADRDRYSWDADPWVWVYTFERCEKPGGFL